MTTIAERPSGAMAHRSRRPRRSFLSGLLGFVGELLITLGVIIGLYIVWQLWWTSLGASREAAAQVDSFYASVAPAAPELVPSAQLRTDEPPVVDPVSYGSTIGVLIVPSWQGKSENRMPIVEGTGTDVLDRAYAGHYVETAMPGQVGNFSVAGHRRSYGNNFLHLPDLVPEDAVVVETEDYWFVYSVTSHDIVRPDQVEVVAPVPGDPGAVPTQRMMTLTTCHSLSMGAFGNDHRWIVHAELVGWLERSAGTPAVVEQMEGAS